MTRDLSVREELPAQNEAIRLYDSVGWSAYTRDPALLMASLTGSHRVYTARTGSDEPVGLARTISDGATICYLQDILVQPSHQDRGIGRALMDRILADYGHVRQVVLLTDDEPRQRAFYESHGLTEVHDVAPRPLNAFVRLG